MNNLRPAPWTSTLCIFATLLVSCGDAAATQAETGNERTGVETGQENTVQAAGKNAPLPVVLPTPEVELPEVPYDKAELRRVRELDELIIKGVHFEAARDLVAQRFRDMNYAAQGSGGGNEESQLRELLDIVGAFEEFEAYGAPMAREAARVFREHFESDQAYAEAYSETYEAAEEEARGVIAEPKIQRHVLNALQRGYRQSKPATDLRELDSLMERYPEIQERVFDRYLASAKTDLHIGDYLKGDPLAQHIQFSKNRLRILRRLDPGNEEIAAALTSLDEKAASRMEAIQNARAKFRFPYRYNKPDAPKNAEELEKSLRADLESRGYRVEAIALAAPWQEIHSVLGIHMYNEIDFHVAVEAKDPEEAKAGVLDVHFITAKTHGEKRETPFRSLSTGTIAQMLKSKL